jgi:hypothetical protein
MGIFFKDILLGCKRVNFLNREDAKDTKEEKKKEGERGDAFSKVVFQNKYNVLGESLKNHVDLV